MTTPAQREQARLRQQRRRERLRQERGELAQRFCLCCREQFQPKRRDSWLCSRRCIERVSHHRKRARKTELAVILSGVRQALHGARNGAPNPLTLADLQSRWQDDPRPAEASYRLWFPDLCGLTPEQAQADRERFQELCRVA